MAIATEKYNCARLRAGFAGVRKMAAGFDYSAFEKIRNFAVEDGAPGKFAGLAGRLGALRIHSVGRAYRLAAYSSPSRYSKRSGRMAGPEIRGIRMRDRFLRTDRERDVS